MAAIAPVAVDAMGGDNAPAEIVRGALRAATELHIPVLLVGHRELLENELARIEGPETVSRARLTIVDAREVVEMDEHPANAVRSKRIPGIARPAIGALLPGRPSRTFLLDVGANADCKPEWLVQFAVMGSVYARTMMEVASPRVGLLSNGEEPGKGSQLVRETYPLLEAAPVRFTGNVESKELFIGACDVAVCDGFAGNVALKAAEGVGEYLFTALRQEAMSSLTARIGGQLLKPRLRSIRDRVDYRHTGGALLLGVAGEVVIAHGRSDALAVMNAIRVASEAARRDVSGSIAGALGATADTREAVDATATSS